MIGNPFYWATVHGMGEAVGMILQGVVDFEAELLMNPRVLDQDRDQSIRTVILSYMDGQFPR